MAPVVKVIQPSGILDGIRANSLRREVSDIVEKGLDILLIDLENVGFVDSSGLAGLLSALKTVRGIGGKLFICSPNEQVQLLFRLTRMERVLETFPSREEFNKTVLNAQE